MFYKHIVSGRELDIDITIFIVPLLTSIFMLTLAYETHASSRSLRYEVDPAKDLTHLDISVCFGNDPPARFYTNGSRARSALQWISLPEWNKRIASKSDRHEITLNGLKSGDCLSYRVDLTMLSAWHRWQGRGVADDIVLTNPDDWLWLPTSTKTSIEIHFNLQPGMEVSVPWQLLPRASESHVYGVTDRNPDWDARVAIGQLNRFDIITAGTPLRVAVLAGDPAVNIDIMHDWLTSGARALATLHPDQSPLPPIQVLVVPVDHADEPVPWAEVQRGGGDAIHLYIDQHRNRSEFINDWTLVHELGHLLHPRLPQADAWLYEGLASYYQNVLRARAGLLTPLTAWRKLHAGFQRGIREIADRQQLTHVAEAMHRNHRYMQVYWSGAAYFLEVDTRLRQMSSGQQSLDSVLAQFRECCLPADKRWHGEAFVNQLDALSDTTLFSDTYQRYRQLRRFPSIDHLYRDLGLSVTAGQLQPDDRAPLAQLRRKIMSNNTTTGR